MRPEADAERPKEPETTAPRRPSRARIALVLAAGVITVSIALSLPAEAGTKEQLDQAKRELAAAQAALGRAAAALNAADSALVQTREEIASTREAIDVLEGRIERTRARLEERAVLAFENGPASTIDILLSSGSFTDFSDKLEFLGSMAQSDSDLVAELEVGTEQLDRTKEDLAALSVRQAAKAEELRSARASAQATTAALSAKYQEILQEYRQELAAQQAASAATQALGQTPQPGAALQVCPVAGPNSFVDSFGWPRVGHTHQGIDLISPFGTPVVAAHPGVVSHSSSSSGGLQAYVRASSGTYTFYAHLSSYSSAAGSVGAGTVIGYVGSTGNAGSVNHLHFEYHPGGGSAVNPYQLLLAVC